jgi:hypothetical protein
MKEYDPRDQHRSSSLDDGDRFRSECCSHCATTAPLTDDSAKLPNTLDAYSQGPESANIDSENDIEEPTSIVNMFTIATQFMNG